MSRRILARLLLAASLIPFVAIAPLPAGQAARRMADPAATPTALADTPTPLADTPTLTATPTDTQTALPTATLTLVPTETPTPSATPSPTKTSPPTNTPLPTSTPRPLTFGPLDHAIIYDDGTELYLIQPDGSGRVGLALLTASPFPLNRPRFSGYEYIYYDNGFFLGDVLGHHTQVVPPLGAGEQVFDAMPSPDGQYIAWVLVTPAMVDHVQLNMGASRIVITDPTGGNARTLVQQNAGSPFADVPIIYGWRPGHPPTLLVQSSYGVRSMLGLHRGLEEFDPIIDDLVGDYLPPVGEGTLPTGEVLGVSPTGFSMVYATGDVRLPSGEGPFPVAISSTSMAQRRVSRIDVVATHKDKATKKLPAPRAYIFSRQVFISPDDTRVAYTRLDILYPPGQAVPYQRPIACLANLDGSGKVDFGPDERVMGWADGHTVVVRREHTHVNGLYAVDLNTGKTKLILLGNNLRVDGFVI